MLRFFWFIFPQDGPASAQHRSSKRGNCSAHENQKYPNLKQITLFMKLRI